VIRRSITILVALAAACTHAAAEPPSDEQIGSVQVYLSPKQAMREIFETVVMVDTVVTVLSREEQAALHERLGRTTPGDTLVVLHPRDKEGDLLGYAVIADEVGKYRPITFMVGTEPDLRVRGVEVLVYRESRGSEVRRSRFLRQYRGKDGGDPIRTNRDIINVAGATLSVHALNHGVKRALLALEILRSREALCLAPGGSR
jgi:Na+-translocating ferredoxin:NAD+ oxidoreductase RnfG subunit